MINPTIYPLPRRPENQFMIKHDYFSLEELQRIFEDQEDIPPWTGNTVDNRVDGVRECEVKSLPWNEKFDWLYEKIITDIVGVNHSNFGYTLTGLELIQFIKYEENSVGYIPHKDCDKPKDDLAPNIRRKLSVSIQLSDEEEYDGGELLLDCDSAHRQVFSKKIGSIVIFDSKLDHQVLPISRGTRYSLVVWFCGPFME